MKKTEILWVLLGSLFVGIFNVIFFLAGGTAHPVSVWVSYGFIHFAYLMLAASPFLAPRQAGTAVLRYPLVALSAGYFIAAFILGVIFILLAPADFRTALIVQLIVAGAYAALLIGMMIFNEHAVEREERRQGGGRLIRRAGDEMETILSRTADPALKKQIEAARDAVKESADQSDGSAAGVEQELAEAVARLGQDVAEGRADRAAKTAGQITRLAQERSRRLRLTD